MGLAVAWLARMNRPVPRSAAPCQIAACFDGRGSGMLYRIPEILQRDAMSVGRSSLDLSTDRRDRFELVHVSGRQGPESDRGRDTSRTACIDGLRVDQLDGKRGHPGRRTGAGSLIAILFSGPCSRTLLISSSPFFGKPPHRHLGRMAIVRSTYSGEGRVSVYAIPLGSSLKNVGGLPSSPRKPKKRFVL